MHVIIAGGLGMIGSRLVNLFFDEPASRITVIDNESTGSVSNIEPHIRRCRRYHLVQSDLQSLPLGIEKCDIIINLASRASPLEFSRNPLDILLANSEGSRLLLDKARRDGATYFYASTSEVYGDPDVHPQSEDYNGNVPTTGPRSCYDESKRFGETLAYTYAKEFGVDVVIGRIFNTYGSAMSPGDGRVIPNFIYQAARGIPLTIYGDGKQTRSFCHVDDMASAIFRLVTQPRQHLVYNIGNPAEISILELAQLIIELSSSSSDIIYSKLPQDDPTRRCPDISRVSEEMHWHPQIGLRKGLQDLLQEFQEVEVVG